MPACTSRIGANHQPSATAESTTTLIRRTSRPSPASLPAPAANLTCHCRYVAELICTTTCIPWLFASGFSFVSCRGLPVKWHVHPPLAHWHMIDSSFQGLRAAFLIGCMGRRLSHIAAHCRFVARHPNLTVPNAMQRKLWTAPSSWAGSAT